jgi:hypothetical protein
MKRLRLLVLAGVLAVALPLGMTAAGATGGSPPPNSVSIKEKAQFNFNGTYIEVGLTVRCQANSNALRTVEVFVHQDFPETPSPTGANGLGVSTVVCDSRARDYAVTVPVGKFDAGRARATATLDPVLGPTATAQRWITIVHV